MITISLLDRIEPGTVFAQGEAVDDSTGLNMSNSGKMLRWVAKRGFIGDWCIYTHFASHSWGYVEECGDKVEDPENIKKLVPCTDAALDRYRH